MSRIAKDPVILPSGVSAVQENADLIIKGPKGETSLAINPNVALDISSEQIQVKWEGEENKAIAGTMRALISNDVTGVSEGFTKNIKLNGVGYRANVQG